MSKKLRSSNRVCARYEIRKCLGGYGGWCVFFHFTIEGERSGMGTSEPSGEGWQVDAMRWCWKSTTCYRVALLGTQVAIFSVCYNWRICSVWQVAWERMNGCSYVIERTMQSLPLLREGGLRNDAARAALWRTRPYECAIDVCQLLTMVIADVRREWVFIFTDLQRIADLFDLTSCNMC